MPTGDPGTPSFYVVHNTRYGWSWRCLSTNCVHSDGPMRHSFRLFQELLQLDVVSAIGAALTRWPEAWGERMREWLAVAALTSRRVCSHTSA